MPRKTPEKPKEEVEAPLDEKAVAEAVAEVHEDLEVEEAAAAFFAAEKSKEDATVDDAIEAEPVLGGDGGEADGGTTDSVPEAPEADAGSVEEERTEPVVEKVDTRTSAERRPTTGGGITIVTQ